MGVEISIYGEYYFEGHLLLVNLFEQDSDFFQRILVEKCGKDLKQNMLYPLCQTSRDELIKEILKRYDKDYDREAHWIMKALANDDFSTMYVKFSY